MIESSDDLPYGFNDVAPLVGQLSVDEDLRLHRLAGSTFIRVVLDWGLIESVPGRFDFSASDELYCKALNRDIAVLFTVTGIPPWAVPDGAAPCETGMSCVQPPALTHLGALTEFSETAASRYPDTLGFEAWNEPNLQVFWPTPDPAAYLAVLKAIHAGVKASAPDTPVVGGSVSNQLVDDPEAGNLSLQTFLTAMIDLGGAEYMDALSVHLYPIGPVGTSEDLLTPALETTRRIAASAKLPIWVTETGITTESGAFSPPVTAEEQSVELPKISTNGGDTGRPVRRLSHAAGPGRPCPGGSRLRMVLLRSRRHGPRKACRLRLSETVRA